MTIENLIDVDKPRLVFFQSSKKMHILFFYSEYEFEYFSTDIFRTNNRDLIGKLFK